MRDRIEQVLANRTRYLCVVTEDLYQPHNGAAVLRACEGFGVQDVYAIGNRNPFPISQEIAAGAERFVDLHTYDQLGQDNTAACINDLRTKGYRIFATSLREGCVPIDEVPLDQPLALMFGTEMTGLSEKAHCMADGFVRLPMVGFTQSFNISVSAALSLLALTTRLRESSWSWQLPAEERDLLRARWTAREVSSD